MRFHHRHPSVNGVRVDSVAAEIGVNDVLVDVPYKYSAVESRPVRGVVRFGERPVELIRVRHHPVDVRYLSTVKITRVVGEADCCGVIAPLVISRDSFAVLVCVTLSVFDQEVFTSADRDLEYRILPRLVRVECVLRGCGRGNLYGGYPAEISLFPRRRLRREKASIGEYRLAIHQSEPSNSRHAGLRVKEIRKSEKATEACGEEPVRPECQVDHGVLRRIHDEISFALRHDNRVGNAELPAVDNHPLVAGGIKHRLQ